MSVTPVIELKDKEFKPEYASQNEFLFFGWGWSCKTQW